MSQIPSITNPSYIIGFLFAIGICFQSVTESPAGIVFLAFLISLVAAHYYLKEQSSENFYRTKKNIGSELFIPYTTHLNKKFENWLTILFLIADYHFWHKSKKSLSIFKKQQTFLKEKRNKYSKSKTSSSSKSHIKNLILSNYWLASKLFNSQGHGRIDNCKIHWNLQTIPTNKFSLWQIF